MAATKKQPSNKFPKTIGECIDRMRALEIEAKGYEAQAKVCWDGYAVLEDHLIATTTKNELTGASGKTARASLEPHEYPAVDDWDKFHEELVFGTVDRKALGAKLKDAKSVNRFVQGILAGAQWDLLQKRVGVEAWRSRLEANVVVPGTRVFTKLKLKLTPIKPGKRGR